MVPLVGTVKELKQQAEIINRVAAMVFEEKGVKVDYKVGTMIEIPRAAITADQIAEVAEFFSFGTNDLTQMTFGYSRDDAGKFLPEYIRKGILKTDPFAPCHGMSADKTGRQPQFFYTGMDGALYTAHICEDAVGMSAPFR